MKKLILTMLIALGGIVSTQAQFVSFNLSCPIDNSGAGVSLDTFYDVQTGFSDAQELGFELADFSVVTLYDESDVYRKAVDRGTATAGPLSVLHGIFYNQRNEQQYNRGPWAFRVVGLGGAGTVDYYQTAAEVVDALMLVVPSAQAVEVNNYNSQNNDGNQVADWNESTANYNIGDYGYTIEYFAPNWEAIDDNGDFNTIIAGSLENVIIAIIDRHSN